MSAYLRIVNDEIQVVIPLNDQVDTSEFIFVDSLPSLSVQAAWVLKEVDGFFSVEVDQDKLVQLQRERMAKLTPIEFDLRLAQFNLYNAVQNLIADNLTLRIAYTRATFFKRTDPFINQARHLLGLTDEQVDIMWQEALQIS